MASCRWSRRHAPVQAEGRDWAVVEEMFLSSRPKFFRVAYGILRNREDAEDAVQDAFLSAYAHFHAFEGRSALKTWFTSIVVNASLMMLRKRKSTRREISVDASPEWQKELQERIPDSQPNPETLCARSETMRVVDTILRKMNPSLREAFVLKHFEEHSVEDGAVTLGIAPANFKARVFRARQHLIARASHKLDRLRNVGFGPAPSASALTREVQS